MDRIFVDAMLKGSCPELCNDRYSYKSYDLHCQVMHVVWSPGAKIERFQVNHDIFVPEWVKTYIPEAFAPRNIPPSTSNG